MRFAIRSHDLGERTLGGLTNALKSYGFDGLQLVPYKTFDNIKYELGAFSDEFIQTINEELIAAQKEVFLLGAYFNPVHSDKTKVEKSLGIFREYLLKAKSLKTDVVASETGSFNDDKWTFHPQNRTDEALERVVKTFRALCDYAQSFGVNVGIEGAAGHVCYDIHTLKRAVDSIDRKNLKIVFDIYNFLDETNHQDYMNILEKGLELFEGRIHCFHIKDYVLEGGKPKQTAVGTGLFDFDGIIQRVLEYDRNAILVFEGTTGQDIETSLSFLKRTCFKYS